MSQFSFKFRYQHQASETKELVLLRFTGHENVSQLFSFDLELKSEETDLDEDGVINQPCCLEIYYGQTSSPIRVIHGLINEFEDVNYLADGTLYRAKMVPRVWQLGLFDTNEVYLDQTIEQTLTVMLEEANFVSGQDFRFDLSRTYRKWPFRLQYNETHSDFLQRIIEREGIYYYFDHSGDGDVIVFCDNNNRLPKMVQSDEADSVSYQANSSAYVASGANTVNSIFCKRQSLPKKITLRDFNEENPSLDIRGESVINSAGVGAINLYGLNITSPEEGQALADIHANAFRCRQKSYIGQGDVVNMSAGHTFRLQDHPRSSFNELEYLIESIEHAGANLNQNTGVSSSDGEAVNYSNSFAALSTALEFVPKRQAVAPEINGTLNAVVDAEAQSGYAELDAYGRYKIKLPFDRKDREGGKASHWVRMMQPYGGVGSGMHFPLRAGTRVLLAFVGGDPDRPFISGTIDDSGDQQSIVTADNQTNSIIKTASGNKIEIEDMEGTNRIKLQTGDNKTYMHLGAPNHLGDGWVVVTDGLERKFIRGGQNVVVATNSDLVTKPADGLDPEANDDHGATGDTTNEGVSDLEFADHQEYKFTKRSLVGENQGPFTAGEELDGTNLFYRSLGNVYVWEKGNEYRYNSPGDTQFKFGIDKVISVSQKDGNLENGYNRSDNFSSNQRINRDLDGADELSQKILNLREGLKGYQCFHEPSPGAVRRKFTNPMAVSEWNDLLDNKSMVTIGRHNTFNIQEGNRFDFGGYWSYNMGNSYTETHGDPTSEINRKRAHAPAVTPWNPLFSTGPFSDYLAELAARLKDEHDLADKGGPHWEHVKGVLVKIENNNKEIVEKIYSDQYKYTFGNRLEIQSGDVEEKIYGKFREDIDGDHIENVTGNQTNTINGDESTTIEGHKQETVGHQTTLTKGNSIEQYWGTQQSYFMGFKSDMSLGLVTETSVGGRRSTEVAAVMETSLAARSTISAGQVMELTAGVLLEINSATKIDVDFTKANTSDFDLSTHEGKMDLVASELSDKQLELTSIGTAICSGALRLFC